MGCYSILRGKMAEQYSGSPIVRRIAGSSFIRQAAGTYSTQLLMAALGVCSSVIAARALGPAGRGTYAVAAAIGAIGVQFLNLGLHSTNSYFLSKDHSLLPSLLANALFAGFLLGGAGAIVLGGTFYLWNQAPLNGFMLLLAVLWIPVGTAYLLVVNLLMGLLRVRLYNTIELVNKVLAVASVAGAVLLGARRPEVLFSLVLLAMLAGFLLALRALLRLSPGRVQPSFHLFRQNFRLGWKVYICCLLAFIVIKIDLLMVKSMLGATAAGYYSIPGTLADYVLLLPTGVAAILFPKLSGMTDDSQKRSLLLKAVAGSSAVLLGILAILALCARFIIVLLFGRAFAPSATPVLFLLPGILFLGIETVLVQYLNSRGFPSSVVALWIGSTVLNIGANLWAIPRYSINGAAAVSSVSYFFALLGVIWITHAKWKTGTSVQEQAAVSVS